MERTAKDWRLGHIVRSHGRGQSGQKAILQWERKNNAIASYKLNWLTTNLLHRHVEISRVMWEHVLHLILDLWNISPRAQGGPKVLSPSQVIAKLIIGQVIVFAILGHNCKKNTRQKLRSKFSFGSCLQSHRQKWSLIRRVGWQCLLIPRMSSLWPRLGEVGNIDSSAHRGKAGKYVNEQNVLICLNT